MLLTFVGIALTGAYMTILFGAVSVVRALFSVRC